ncbi:DNA-3-methyladenine glycosylase [Lysobacter soyae]|uniref:Putative 3-methyladenine DNA glycosylase n=1 Tax=Lysobacter soyae TaxID=2764185 RepID=A0ABX8WS12_9GAMM|nr:DNA-3-methyladenine glycosylase [Lysobacter sp. CJ11]
MQANSSIVKTLTRRFFDRMPHIVAPELLGKCLVAHDGRMVRIVETEAYAQDDPAAHTFRGETARNRSMFGPPGHMYVYFSYGVHWCANVVCGPKGFGAGVLLRAAQPMAGIDLMEAARGNVAFKQLCNGPGKLAQAMGIDRHADGTDVVGGGPFTVIDDAHAPVTVIACPRIGISKAVEAPLRFVIADNPFVSKRPMAR